jgi:hypothetical protein
MIDEIFISNIGTIFIYLINIIIIYYQMVRMDFFLKEKCNVCRYLKWLKLHRNNPYPSKTEKVMLAYSTRMTITQISNWFGNARRRIKQQKSCDKSHDSLLESSYDENLHRTLQENAQLIKSLSIPYLSVT